MLKVLVLDTDNVSMEVRDIEDELEVFYEIIGCRCIDIPSRKIGSKYYDIIVDDEGLLVGKMVSAIDENFEPMLVGNLIICNSDQEGNLVSLTDEDISIIQHSVKYGYTRDGRTAIAVKMSY